MADEGLFKFDGRTLFLTEEVQRNTHRDVRIRINALEVHVHALVLVRMHLEGTQNDELIGAVQFHRQNRSVELFFLQIVEQFLVVDFNGRCGDIVPVQNAGDLVLAAQAAARTRSLYLTRFGDDFHEF